MFNVALYLPWCWYLEAQKGVKPTILCVCPTIWVWFCEPPGFHCWVCSVGWSRACTQQECLDGYGKDWRCWILSYEGDKWSVKLDVRDPGGHLDTTLRRCSASFSVRGFLVKQRWLIVAASPLDFHGRRRVMRIVFIPGALRGIEASLLSQSSLLGLRDALVAAVWSKRQPLARGGSVLSLLDGPEGCGFCIVWFRFRMLRRYLAYRSNEERRLYLTGVLLSGILRFLGGVFLVCPV